MSSTTIRAMRVTAGSTEPDPEMAALLFDTVQEARAVVARGLIRIPHQAGEDSVILETWL